MTARAPDGPPLRFMIMLGAGGRPAFRLKCGLNPHCRASENRRLSDERFIVSKPVHWALVFVALAVAGVSGCNTIRGMGEDVEAAGGAVAGTAEKTEKKLTNP